MQTTYSTALSLITQQSNNNDDVDDRNEQIHHHNSLGKDDEGNEEWNDICHICLM